MWQLFIASFCDQTEIEGNGRQQNMTNDKKLKQQALLKLKKAVKKAKDRNTGKPPEIVKNSLNQANSRGTGLFLKDFFADKIPISWGSPIQFFFIFMF